MNATIILDPVRVDTGSADRDGLLAYRNGALIGVLTHLDPDLHEEEGVGRHWFLEAGFGRVAEAPRPRPFRSLDEARSWLRQHAAGVTPRCAAAILQVKPRCAAAGHSPSAGWCGIGPAPRR
ncbi:hypothetical protein [Methylobacterium sp. SyP6R]|uniref:hypothetical protein n=1 Tax=Methylobacterium sp. SyP6R TaxID=2718876 RepID=UPI001F293F66|nr:hypothetical protein [Methylobacterium sp. SyP6R]MCF4126480.1 hypothetical protein [Methylobacterium sp. SyP6R]